MESVYSAVRTGALNKAVFKGLKLSYLQQNVLKSLCCYNSHEVSLCGGCIYSLCVDAIVVLDRYVLIF